MIVDASVLLRAFFPDESQMHAQEIIREHVAKRIQLKAPQLLIYEFSNAVWQAERRARITRDQAGEIIQAITGLEIELIAQSWGDMLPLARQFNLSAYDAAYLTLAKQTGEPLITGDERLLNAAGGKSTGLIWIEDYRPN